MILSFGDMETEKIWNGILSKKLSNEIQKSIGRKLRIINNSINLVDLTIPPSNKLEKLKGDFKEFYGIRIYDQWRIIFKFKDGNIFEVRVIDYH
jgi:toxin HigB-1